MGGDGIPYRIRTGVSAVKGRRPRPLDERDTRNAVIASTQHSKREPVG